MLLIPPKRTSVSTLKNMMQIQAGARLGQLEINDLKLAYENEGKNSARQKTHCVSICRPLSTE
jgi:hypothetical protein